MNDPTPPHQCLLPISTPTRMSTHARTHARTHSPVAQTPKPTATITTHTVSFWQIVSGAVYCHISDGGRCVSDGYGNYGNNEHCTIMALRSLVATATEFDTESCCDFLTIGGTQYSGFQGPRGLPLAQGTVLVWTSDASDTKAGFKLCAVESGSFAIARNVLYYDVYTIPT